jgi:glycosyltransferase involved in cell wall biosynthesis
MDSTSPTSPTRAASKGKIREASYSVKLTVVIPHRLRDDNLRHCLFSIATQTRLPHEVVVVDYDSLDSHTGRRRALEELALTEGLRLRIVYGGPPEEFRLTTARNKGTREASTQYIASLDADCTLSAPSLIDAEMWLDRDNVSMVGAPVLYCMEEGFSYRPPWYGTYPSGGFQAFRACDIQRAYACMGI